jgi:hypothetical protein
MIICVGGNLNSLDVWAYDDVRVLVATRSWLPNNWTDRHCHITNGSVNRDANGYNEKEQNISMDDVWGKGSDMCVSLREQMTEDLVTLMKSVHLQAKKSSFMSLPGTYELFGVDWAIDSNGKAWLLEINPEPSMKVYPHLKGGRAEMIRSGPLSMGGDGKGLPDGWEKMWSSKLLDAMRRLRGR